MLAKKVMDNTMNFTTRMTNRQIHHLSTGGKMVDLDYQVGKAIRPI